MRAFASTDHDVHVCKININLIKFVSLSEHSINRVGMVHSGISCGSCLKCDIHGIRWKCTECPDVNLCTPCYYSGRLRKHSLDHQFSRINHKDDNIDSRYIV